MTRFAAISAIFLTGAFATMVSTMYMQTTPVKTIHEIDESQFDEKTREMVISYFFFKNTLTTTIELLADGKIGLVDARDRVHEAAQRYFPDYLKHIEGSDPAPRASDRVARNLIGHLRNLEESDLTLSPRILALQIEYASRVTPVPAQPAY